MIFFFKYLAWEKMADNTYLQAAINGMTAAEPCYTPAQQVHVDNFNNAMTNVVNNGGDPIMILKMAAIITMLRNKGLTAEQLQTHHMLIAQLCFISDFDTRDDNIDCIYERITNAQ